MKQTIRIILASALIAAAALKGVPALAEPTPPVAVSIVSTSDLDLTTAAGQGQLQARLSQAARDVCGVASDADLKGKNAVRKCRDVVLADANAQREQLLASRTQGMKITLVASR